MAFVEVTEISQVYFKQKFYNYGNSFEIQTQKSVCEVEQEKRTNIIREFFNLYHAAKIMI